MQLTYSTAVLSDAPFIESLLMVGARKSNFNPELLSNRNVMRKDLDCMISNKHVLDTPLFAEILVYKVGVQRAGFSIVTGITDFPNSIEIYALALHKQFQGLGLGSKILDEILNKWLPHNDVYARCATASERFYQMLLRRQFEYRFTMPNEIRVMHCQQYPNVSHA